MNFHLLKRKLQDLNQPDYRFAQAKRAFAVDYVDSWEAVSTFPKAVRDALSAEIPWMSILPITTQVSKEGDTVKTLFNLVDGKKIEAVLMRHEGGRNTVCLSSQVGCPMACTFCATGTMGLKRNLTAEEMFDQVIFYAHYLKSTQAHVTNVVFMGMGEPMHNYDEVMESVRLLNDPTGFNLGARHISISTCGIVPGILKLADEPLQVNLAISLHSAIDKTRSSIMPVNNAYSVKKLMDAIDVYTHKTNRKVFFEYLLLDGINDTKVEARAVANLLQHNYRLFHVNLIKFHDTDQDAYKATQTDSRLRFMRWLQEFHVPVTHRRTFGEDIDAACGQLAVNESAGLVSQGKTAIRANKSAKRIMKVKA